jgi:hypothetical protein
MWFWVSDRQTPAENSLYRSNFLDDDILHCLLRFLSLYALDTDLFYEVISSDFQLNGLGHET